MPMATLLAVADHGEVTGPTAEHDPTEALAALADAGIDMKQVTDELLIDGVKQFEDAMTELLAGIESGARRSSPAVRRRSTRACPADLEEPVAERVETAVGDTVAQRVWQRDPSLWGGPGVPEIEDRLGWLTVSETMLEQAPELDEFAAEVRDEGFTDAVLLGMGGLLARSGGDPAVVRRAPGRAAPAGARLDPPRRDPRRPGVDRPREDAVHRLVEVGRHDRDALALPLLQGARAARASSSSSPTRAARSRRSPNKTGCDACSPNPPDIGGRYSVLS